MVLWIFLPTLFFMFDILVYFLLGFSHIITTMGFVIFSFFNPYVPQRVRIIGIFYALLQASIFYNTIFISSIFCLVIKLSFSKISFFLRDGIIFNGVLTFFCMGLYVVLIEKSGLIELKSCTSSNFFVTMTITLIQSLFLNSIYKASGQSNRLRKARGKSGHQTGNEPFDKIRTGSRYC